MKLFRCFAIALLASHGCAVAADVFRLPPINGELSGDFRLLEGKASPVLHWTAGVRSAGAGTTEKTLTLSATGDGARVQAEIALAEPDQGRWKITEGEIDLAKWFPWFAGKFGQAVDGLVAGGTITVKGNGEIRDGRVGGVVEMTLRDGRLAKADGAWSLDGVSVSAELSVEADLLKSKSVSPFSVTVASLTTTRLGARKLFVTGRLGGDGSVAVDEARIEIAGGEVRIEPTTLLLSPLGLDATLHIAEVGMQDLAALVPRSFSAAEGRIDGTVRLGWTLADGFRVGAGNLVLGKSETAIVRLAPAPGFLTRGLPRRFEPVPRWLGPVSTWLSADNPAYIDTAEIELGRAALEVESLNVRLTPDGDEQGRTATVRIRAKPAKSGVAVGAVNIDVNVTGPLDSILKLGINRELSVEVQR